MMRALLICVFLAVPFFNAASVWAEEDEQQYDVKTTGSIRADVYEELEKAQTLQQEGQIKQAIEVLDQLKARTGKKALKPYELAQVHNFYAYAYLAEDDYHNALKAFEQILALKQEIPQALYASTQFTMAQLYFATDQLVKGIKVLEQWFIVAENPGPDAYVLLSQGYLQQGNIDKALKPLLQAFDVAKAQGKPEKEQWYNLLQYIYSEKKAYKKQLAALEVLAERWPKRIYWLSLAAVYSQLDMPKKQLYVMDIAYQQGFLDTESSLRSFAQLLASFDVPYKAAQVMEQGLEDELIEKSARNLERIGDYFRRAREVERAIPYLEEAAKMSDSGEQGQRLAYLYISLYQYDNAIKALKLALKKGKLKRPMETELLLAQAFYNAKKFEQARKQLQRILDTAISEENKRYKQQAKQWLAYLENEIARQKEIELYLEASE